MKRIIPFTPNTGGTVKPEYIVGRDEEIELFWRKLEKQGVTLFAERRFGKSSILRKMEHDGKPGFVTIYNPVEGEHYIDGFISKLLDRVKELELIDEGVIKIIENLYNIATDMVEEVKGLKLKRLEYTWQKQLLYLLNKLIEKHKDKKIVIILDEFSIFLSNLQKIDAYSVIGFLRNITLENKFSDIRFVYCGSVGIDLVLNNIKKEGYNIGDPLNHMYKHELQPFTKDNAIYFGMCLNLGCKLNLSSEHIQLICSRSNNIPYFIDIVFDKISNSIKGTTLEKIENAFEEIIDDTKGKESIRHFYDRIGDFYPKKIISFHILNFVSRSSMVVTETEIYNYVLSSTAETNRIEINDEIERLVNDGYLIRTIKDEGRAYNFKYSLLKLWWKRNKA
jgi:hypothetical protein